MKGLLVKIYITYVFFIVSVFLFKFLKWYRKILIFVFIFVVMLIIISVILEIKNRRTKNHPFKLNKKFREKYPIIIQYVPPKGINSAEAWFLYNCKVEPSDLTSLMYQWAYEGFIEIDDGSDSENMTKIILKKLKDLPNDRPFFETDMFNSIFMWWKETKVISSSNQLKYALFLEDLQIHGINKWWFEKVKIPLFVKILYALLIWSEIVFLFVDFEIFSILFILFVIMSWYIFGYEKIQLTDKWAELVSYLIWYRDFIKNCDETHINSLLKEDPLFLDKSLPYATAFGLETVFLKKTTPLLKDWNAKYLCWKKVSPLSDIVDWVLTVGSAFNLFGWLKHLKFLR